jgi:hypothetical protein
LAQQHAAAVLIINTMGSGQLMHVRGIKEDPNAIWMKLKNVHEENGLSSQVVLWKAFHAVHIDMLKDPIKEVKRITSTILYYTEKLKCLFGDRPSDYKISSQMLSTLDKTQFGLVKCTLEKGSKISDTSYVIDRNT